MNDQELLAAARALRIVRDGSSSHTRETEDLVLRRSMERQRSHRARWLLPIAAVLVMSSAWASTQPGLRRQLSAFFARASPPPAARDTAHTPPSTSVSQAPASNASAATVLRPGDAGARRQAPPDASATVLRRPAASKRTSSTPSNASAVPSTPREPTPLELYQRAHALHFGRQDCVAALPAWDEYLTRAATDALALEARFNRGVCLFTVGRVVEARAALAPFAAGNYGGYRREEAQRLLDRVAP